MHRLCLTLQYVPVAYFAKCLKGLIKPLSSVKRQLGKPQADAHKQAETYVAEYSNRP